MSDTAADVADAAMAAVFALTMCVPILYAVFCFRRWLAVNERPSWPAEGITLTTMPTPPGPPSKGIEMTTDDLREACRTQVGNVDVTRFDREGGFR